MAGKTPALKVESKKKTRSLKIGSYYTSFTAVYSSTSLLQLYDINYRNKKVYFDIKVADMRMKYTRGSTLFFPPIHNALHFTVNAALELIEWVLKKETNLNAVSA